MGLEEPNEILKTEKPEVKSEVKIPKKEDENAQKNNDIFMSQFEYDGDRGSYELLKMIKGAIDEDPTQRNLAQSVINSSNTTNTNTDTNANNTNNQQSSHVDIVKGDNAQINNNNNNNQIGTTYNSSYENFKKDLLKYDGIDLSKTDNKEGAKVINAQVSAAENKIDLKTGPKEQRSIDEILAEIKSDKKEMEQMKLEEEKKLEQEKEQEEEEDDENELEGFKLQDIVDSGADIEFNLPKDYMPNFESPVYSVITMIMDKYGFEFIIDKLVKNGNKKKNVEERKEEINMANENFNMGDNMGDNLWDDKKEVSNLEEKKEDANKEEKKEVENLEEKKDEMKLEEKKENSEITNENKNADEKKEESKVEEKAEEKPVEVPKEEPKSEAPKEEPNSEVPKEEVKSEVPQENKLQDKKVENAEEKKEENNLENKGEKMIIEEEKKEGEDKKVNEPAEAENKKEEEKKEQEGEKHQMNDDLWNQMDIDNGAMTHNNDHQNKVHELNISLHSNENETEEDAKLRKVLNSLVTMGGYSNIVYFVVQYSNYLNSIKPDKKDSINPLFEDDGNYGEYLNMEETHTSLLTEREIIKLKREPNTGNNLPSANTILMPLKKEKEKPAPKKTYQKQNTKPVYPDDGGKYYQKGGRVGMHYFTSNDDGNIYKYYCIQYNNDGTYGFKCAENQCRSKALLDRNKNFNILSKHTMDFRDHKKLHGSYLRDRFIKFMLQKNLKEIQLTKKDDKKVIEWYK